MTRSTPPALALAILRLAVRGNEPLVGDLIEEYSAGRSRIWFWRQVLRAAAHPAWRQPLAAPRPGLLRARPRFDYAAPGLPLLDPATMNLSGIKVRGVGGLGLIAIVGLITVVLPQAWWLVVGGIGGGVLLGIVKVITRRHRGLSGPDGGRPISILGAAQALRDTAAEDLPRTGHWVPNSRFSVS